MYVLAAVVVAGSKIIIIHVHVIIFLNMKTKHGSH